jgi:hypothetical protein
MLPGTRAAVVNNGERSYAVALTGGLALRSRPGGLSYRGVIFLRWRISPFFHGITPPVRTFPFLPFQQAAKAGYDDFWRANRVRPAPLGEPMKFGGLAAVVLGLIGLIVVVAIVIAHGGGSGSGSGNCNGCGGNYGTPAPVQPGSTGP